LGIIFNGFVIFIFRKSLSLANDWTIQFGQNHLNSLTGKWTEEFNLEQNNNLKIGAEWEKAW
jgi:hypothetical protein